MDAQTNRRVFICLLALFSVSLFILSLDHLQNSDRWTFFSKMLKPTTGSHLDDSDSKSWQKVRIPTPSASLIATKTQTTTLRKRSVRLKASTLTTPPQTETPIPIILKKSFNKLPHWDFDDAYSQDAPPRLTTCVESLRSSKDEGFRKVFLPNIRLFLYKDAINMSEWNRLSHFNNPFGFMEYKYEDVMAAVRLITEPKEPLLSPKPGSDGCIRCAVVGNGGILNGSKKGEEIDAHDYVFRMNGAIIKGYEEDVGSRTSVYIHTAHSITASPSFFRKYGFTGAPHDEGIKYVMIPEGMRDFQWLVGLFKGERVSSGQYRNKEPRTFYSGQFSESRFYVLHQDFLRYVRNRFLPSRGYNEIYWDFIRPSNGAFSLFLALHTCDMVSAYGFMTEDYNNYSNYYFQRTKKIGVVFYVNHDYLLEKDLWKKLDEKKVIKLYQRSSTST